MVSSKKGFMYVMTVSLLIVMLIFVFLTVQPFKYQDEQKLTATRVVAMSDFVKTLNEDVYRATYISSFRALLSLEDHVAKTGDFLNDTETMFVEAFVNGTVEGIPAGLMNDSTFTDYLTEVNLIANRVGLQSSFKVNGVMLEHISPWVVEITVNLSLFISDTRGVASWNTTALYPTSMPIFDLRDPLYTAFTDNRVPNTIRNYSAVTLVNASNNDTAAFIDFANNSYYRETALAPSFLQHFENNVTPHPFGIESLVSVADISAQELTVYPNRVKVDFMYFNDLAASKVCAIQNVSTSLYMVLPNTRLTLYDLSGLNYSTSCP